jgi:hypothetical protein
MDNHSLALIAAFITQIKANGFGAFLIDRAQKSESPLLAWISKNTPWVTRLVSFLFASGTALGIHATYVHTANGTLTITGLGYSAIAGALFQIGQNYAIQHGWGKLFGLDMTELKSLAKLAFGFPGAVAPGPAVGIGLSSQPQTGGATKP